MYNFWSILPQNLINLIHLLYRQIPFELNSPLCENYLDGFVCEQKLILNGYIHIEIKYNICEYALQMFVYQKMYSMIIVSEYLITHTIYLILFRIKIFYKTDLNPSSHPSANLNSNNFLVLSYCTPCQILFVLKQKG